MTAMRGGLDMRGTASFLNRFWKDQSGATVSEVIVILAIVGTLVVGTNILMEGSISQVHLDR